MWDYGISAREFQPQHDCTELNDYTHMKEISTSDTKGVLRFPLSLMYM